jgi:hypothetical protein
MTQSRSSCRLEQRSRSTRPEHVPPDVTAGIFWSKNRRPDRWRDTWHLEAAVGKYLISDKPLTAGQWIKERALLVDAEAVDVTPKDRSDEYRGK